MITITFLEVKVKIPVKSLTFDIPENMIFDITQNIARMVFAKALADIDKYLRKNRKRGQLENTGKRKKTFMNRFGDVTFIRTLFIQPIRQSPLYLVWGLIYHEKSAYQPDLSHDRMFPGYLILLSGGSKPSSVTLRSFPFP